MGKTFLENLQETRFEFLPERIFGAPGEVQPAADFMVIVALHKHDREMLLFIVQMF